MQKISVIVPTMWRANHLFSKMIPFILDSPFVCELIIIDNDSKLRPNNIDLSSEKIKILDFGENIFFNKSMNVGVENSKGDIVCLLNDGIYNEPFNQLFWNICPKTPLHAPNIILNLVLHSAKY